MARYRTHPAPTAVIHDDIVEHLRGGEARAADDTAQHWRLVAGWELDPDTGRPVCRWTLEER